MLAVNFDSSEKRLMSRQLKVSLLKPEVIDELGYIKGARTLVGREPDEGGIPIPVQGVSRNHGMFARLRTHWFYKDMQSTNGSWINGKQVSPNEWKLIRTADVVQLADAAIKISGDPESMASQNRVSGFPALGGVTLIVFSKGEFVDEFPVPDFGRALVIGGSQGDLQIEGTLEEAPNLIIERRSMNVCAYGISKSIKLLHNDADLAGNVNLNDRDEIKVGHYYIIFNNPEVVGKTMGGMTASEAGGQTGAWKEWSNNDNEPDFRVKEKDLSDSKANYVNSMFGKSHEESGNDETISISAEEVDQKIAGFDRHPSMRFMAEEEEPHVNSLGNLDEKIIFFIGIVLLLGLIGLMMYWLLG